MERVKEWGVIKNLIQTNDWDNATIQILDYSVYYDICMVKNSFNYLEQFEESVYLKILKHQFSLEIKIHAELPKFFISNLLYKFKNDKSIIYENNYKTYLEILYLISCIKDVYPVTPLLNTIFVYTYNKYKKKIHDKEINYQISQLIKIIHNLRGVLKLKCVQGVDCNIFIPAIFSNCTHQDLKNIYDQFHSININIYTCYYILLRILKTNTIIVLNLKDICKILKIIKNNTIHTPHKKNLTFLLKPQIFGYRRLFMNLIHPYIVINKLTYEEYIKSGFVLPNALKNINISLHEKLQISLKYGRFIQNIEEDNEDINFIDIINNINSDNDSVIIDFIKFKRYILPLDTIALMLKKCPSMTVISYILKKYGNYDELPNILIETGDEYYKVVLKLLFSNYKEHYKYDYDDNEILNEKYLTFIKKNKNIVKWELKKRIKIFFKITENLLFENVLKIALKYLIDNNLVISNYFVINKQLSELLKIPLYATIHINTLPNIITHFYK